MERKKRLSLDFSIGKSKYDGLGGPQKEIENTKYETENLRTAIQIDVALLSVVVSYLSNILASAKAFFHCFFFFTLLLYHTMSVFCRNQHETLFSFTYA